MSSGTQFHSDGALVRGLVHAGAGRRPFTRVPTSAADKHLASLTASAAILLGAALASIEDDLGMELLVVTRGAETLSFENRAQVASWLNHMAGIRVREEGRPHAPA